MDYLAHLFLLSARHSAVLSLVPVFNLRAMPVVVRLALAVLLSAAVLPPGSQPGPSVPTDHGFFLILVKEMLVGGLVGFGVALVLAAFQAAGDLVGLQLGLSLSGLIDPMGGTGESMMDSFYNLLAGLVFFASNAHHAVLAGLWQLSVAVPVGQWDLGPGTEQVFLSLAGTLFVVALRVALPVIAVMLVADVALAVLSRLAPQMQTFFVGLPAKLGLGLLVLLLTLPALVSEMVGTFDAATDRILVLFRGT